MPLYRARLRSRASLAGAAGGFGRDRGGHIPSAGYVAQRHEWRNDERGHVQHSQLSRRCQTCTETLVDYRGFRLLAVSVLPVSRKTICYGSHDAGLTVHSDYPAFNRKLKGTYASPLLPLPRFVPSHSPERLLPPPRTAIFTRLNLKGHRVKKKILYGPGGTRLSGENERVPPPPANRPIPPSNRHRGSLGS